VVVSGVVMPAVVELAAMGRLAGVVVGVAVGVFLEGGAAVLGAEQVPLSSVIQLVRGCGIHVHAAHRVDVLLGGVGRLVPGVMGAHGVNDLRCSDESGPDQADNRDRGLVNLDLGLGPARLIASVTQVLIAQSQGERVERPRRGAPGQHVRVIGAVLNLPLQPGDLPLGLSEPSKMRLLGSQVARSALDRGLKLLAHRRGLPTKQVPHGGMHEGYPLAVSQARLPSLPHVIAPNHQGN